MWKFGHPPKDLWKQRTNVERFLDFLKIKHKIKDDCDWVKVTSLSIQDSGGRGLLRRFGSLESALRLIYSRSINIIHLKLSTPQKQVWNHLQQLGISSGFIVNFRSKTFTHEDSNKEMEFDFYNPNQKLAIEFHGGQHYAPTYRGSYNRQMIRDQHKRETCIKAGITLVEIPFYEWDNRVQTLKSLILEKLPNFKFFERSRHGLFVIPIIAS